MSNSVSPHPVARRLHDSPAARGATGRGRLIGIQAKHGAPLLAALPHAGHTIGNLPQRGYVPLRGIFDFGPAGVDFFFVLRGFIIAQGIAVHGRS
jgi:peptidoglycan/LPS O-acetylase OafA/YrhL